MAADSYQKSSITAQAAQKMIEAAEAKAKEIGVPMCIAVVDDAGHLKAFRRMDGAALLSIQIAQDKAFT
ncbi:MAG TPA: heme-binding protein, partial [Ktedonobacteraceae bacterium]